MSFSISCTPSKTLENCARLVTVVLNDPGVPPECQYTVEFTYPSGVKDLSTPALSGTLYKVDANVPYQFVVKADTAATLSIIGRKVCPTEKENVFISETALKDYDVLECNEKNAVLAGISSGLGAAGLAAAIIVGTKAGGGVGSIGGPWGIAAGLLIGAVVGGVVYAIARPQCCKKEATLVKQGQRVSAP
jgi:hypothetical protein